MKIISSQGKNRFKSIIRTDRYGVKYVKNFTLWADGNISLQRWDDNNYRPVNRWWVVVDGRAVSHR